MGLHEGEIRDIGDLDDPIEIYNRVSSDTDYSFTESNVLVSSEWAQLIAKTRTMREEVAGGKESSVQEVHWRVRKSAVITTKNWIKSVEDGYWYDIITILPKGRDYKILVTQLRHDAQIPD